MVSWVTCTVPVESFSTDSVAKLNTQEAQEWAKKVTLSIGKSTQRFSKSLLSEPFVLKSKSMWSIALLVNG